MDYDLGTLAGLAKKLGPGGMQLKFVITYDAQGRPRPADLRRSSSILKSLQGGGTMPVFFIPEAYGKGEYLQRCKALGLAIRPLAKRLKSWDLRVQPQWHRVLHGDSRGF